MPLPNLLHRYIGGGLNCEEVLETQAVFRGLGTPATHPNDSREDYK
ncbi:MAG: hypothetical protein ABSH28_16015 [Acidobacteriota bacterium]